MPDPVILDFSGIYEEESFWKNANLRRIDLKDIPGTNCYCDTEAACEILERTGDLPEGGLRYIDSGNYHYVSFLLAGRIRTLFDLLVFDHHTDMQEPQFGDILSCGSWIRHLIKKNPLLNRVILVGPPRKDFDETEDALKEKVILFSESSAITEYSDKITGQLGNLPLYISVDKDVLRPEDARTTWSQGSMDGESLLAFLNRTVQAVGKENILALDICGESGPGDNTSGLNDRMNEKILKWYGEVFDEE